MQALPVQLTVRGTLVPTSLEAARQLHNDTAGSPPGIAAARGLGDLSHQVFAPVARTRTKHGAQEQGELLFLDTWCDAQGIGQFFSDAHVQSQAQRMFSAKDATIWMRATGAYSYALAAPRNVTARFVGLARGPIASPEAAIAAFAAADAANVRDARRRGLVSHDVFIKLPMPGDTAGAELLALDVWYDLAGLEEQYADAVAMKPLGTVFSGRPALSVWEQAPGQWNEW